MRGYFEVDGASYPCHVSFVGVDEVVVVDHRTGTELTEREPVQPKGTPERDAQWARLADVARGANAKIRAEAPLPGGVNIPLGHVTDSEVAGD